jgi:two-component system phosphate regulon sensor histidine kinase PhoR
MKMKINRINIVILLGLIAIIGILVAQLLWTKQAFTIEERKFSQKAHIALLEVAKKLYQGNNQILLTDSPVKKISNDYYIVNIENDFEPDVLEFYLKSEFKKIGIITDFEYAMYNCQSDEMVYGNYISQNDNSSRNKTINFPKHKNLIYYFAVRFPNETNYLFDSLQFWVFLFIALIIILLVYVYSIFTILQQKKYSELQRDFINNMTHEFKTPLSSILIASNYLLQQKEISNDDKLYKYTNIIIKQSNNLNKHIEKILNLAKADNVPLELNKKSINILPIIEDVIENIQLKYEFSTISVISENNSYLINADEFHFTNLVYNLIDNAIKYSENKPIISIKISENKDTVKLQFIDNGIGISVKNLPFIYDKFYRIESQKSNEVYGFGLGLYYVKKICDLHHWKIIAKNNTIEGINITVLITKK